MSDIKSEQLKAWKKRKQDILDFPTWTEEQRETAKITTLKTMIKYLVDQEVVINDNYIAPSMHEIFKELSMERQGCVLVVSSELLTLIARDSSMISMIDPTVNV